MAGSWAGAYGAGAASDELHTILAERLKQQMAAEAARSNLAQEAEAGARRQQQDAFQAMEMQAATERETQRRAQEDLDRKEDTRRFDLGQQQHKDEMALAAQAKIDAAAAAAAAKKEQQDFQSKEAQKNRDFQLYLSQRQGGEKKQWLNRGGHVVFDAPQAGDAPMSTREQGRPVLASDANKVTDYDTSLSDLGTLRKGIPKGTTGVAQQAVAALPNFVNEALGGYANEAKIKQAMIDRVKQTIGKTMEGGVLRKEDEAKYEKILPTIADSDEVVQAKLTALEGAINARRDQHLENLGSAGYDVSRFSRGAKTPGGGGSGMVRLQAPDGTTREVPEAQAAHYLSKGAKLVQ